MADRKVRLIIEVDDKDVKATEQSLNRLGVSVKNVGDSSAGVDKMTGSMIKGSFAGNLMADAIQRVPELAIRAAEAGFRLAEGWSQVGVKVEKARQITGFQVEMLSALEAQTHKTDVGFDQLGEGIKLFTKLIGDANNGSDAAEAKLTRLGLKPVQAAKDLDGAFREVLKRIVSLPTEVQQANAAMDAFGEQGFKLLPFFKSFNGDIDQLIAKAKEMGVVMSGENVRAAVEFDKSLKEVQERARALGITFGRELADPIKGALDDINSGLNNNKGVVTEWAKWVGDKVHGLVLDLKKEANDVGAIGDFFDVLFGGGTFKDLDEKWDKRRTADSANQIERERLSKGLWTGTSWNPDQGDDYADFKAGKLPLAMPNTPYFSGDSPDKAKKGPAAPKPEPQLSPKAKSIIASADKLGVSPIDLATLMLYETSGTLSTSIVGGKGNNYQGLIQFGPSERKQFGVHKGQSFDSQMDSVVAYMKARGLKPGADLLTMYKTVNGGNPNVSENASDGNGTIRSHVEKMIRDRRPQAAAMFKGFNADGKSVADDVSRMMEQQSDRLTKEHSDQIIDSMIEMWSKMGIIPDSNTLGQFQRRLAEKNRIAGDRQTTMGEAKYAFQLAAAERASQGGDITTTGSVSSNFSLRPSLDEDYIKNFREQLGIEQRMERLVFSRRNMEGEISAELESQVLDRMEATTYLEKEFQILQRRNLAEEASVRLMSDRNQLTRQIGDLEIELMNQGKNDALIVQAAYLRDILDLRNRELDAVIRTNRAQLELSQAMTVSTTQIRAGIYEHMAAQKTLNEGIVDGINGTYDAILRRMNEPLDKLNEKSKGMLSFITEPLKAMQGQALNGLFTGIVDKIFPGMGTQMEDAKNPMLGQAKRHTTLLEQIAQNTGGLPVGYAPSGGGAGGVFGKVLGIFGGGGQGPGGTPNWNPNAGGQAPSPGNSIGPDGLTNPGLSSLLGGGQGGNSPLAGLKSMFDPVGGSKAAGYISGGGAVAQMVGGMIGNNRLGKTLQYAGMGAQLGAKIGSMFGPVGALVGAVGGAAIGALIGLFTGRDNAEKKLKEAAAAEFGINVKDKNVLKALKQLGEGMFGKGKVGANARAVVRSEEGMNILRAYAEDSGQSGLKIDRLNYGDANWSGNNFTQSFGGFGGGSVTGGGGSRASVVGARISNGSVMPASPSMSVSSGSGGGAIDRTLLAGLSEAIYQLKDEVSTLRTEPEGALVKRALEKDPEMAADAYHSALGNNQKYGDQQSQLTGRNY